MKLEESKLIHIYTDGSSLGNPGKSGWASILIYKNITKEIYGYSKYSTNNQMELTAVIESLKIVKKKDYLINIYTDSIYVKNGITNWIYKWKKNNWTNSSKSKIKNLELWMNLDSLVSYYSNITWNWVKAHNGNKYNEMADKLARKIAKSN